MNMPPIKICCDTHRVASFSPLSNGSSQTPFHARKAHRRRLPPRRGRLTAHTTPLVFRDEVCPQLIDDHRFWYRNTILQDRSSSRRCPKQMENGLDRKSWQLPSHKPSTRNTALLSCPCQILEFTDQERPYRFLPPKADGSIHELQKTTLIPQRKRQERLGRKFFLSPDGTKYFHLDFP